MIQYFSHDTNARNDEKVIKLRMRHGAAGYGIYFMILERLAESSDHTASRSYEALAFDLHEDIDLIKSVVEDFDLFFLEDDCFWSVSMHRRLNDLDQAQKQRTERARKAAEARYQKQEKRETCSVDANAMLEQCTSTTQAMQEQCSGKPIKERKENKENKIKINPPQISSFNEAAGAAEEEEDLVKIYFQYFSKAWAYQFLWPPGISQSDVIKLTRFFSDDLTVKSIQEAVARKVPIYEVVQIFESYDNESGKNSRFLPRHVWNCLTKLRSMTLADQKKIKSLLIGHPELFDDLSKLFKEIEGNDKIHQPSRYIISKLTNGKPDNINQEVP